MFYLIRITSDFFVYYHFRTQRVIATEQNLERSLTSIVDGMDM